MRKIFLWSVFGLAGLGLWGALPPPASASWLSEFIREYVLPRQHERQWRGHRDHERRYYDRGYYDGYYDRDYRRGRDHRFYRHHDPYYGHYRDRYPDYRYQRHYPTYYRYDW